MGDGQRARGGGGEMRGRMKWRRGWGEGGGKDGGRAGGNFWLRRGAFPFRNPHRDS